MARKGRYGDGVDLISSLPDEILQHILSSLKTTTAIKTSTLSKRWRHVWTGTPSLDLFWSKIIKFDSINKTLARYTSRKMTSFQLYAGSNIECAEIDRSIAFAMSKNVESMSLDIRSHKYNIPDFLYSDSSIEQLTLSLSNFYSHPICSVSWTSLKKLSLFYCNFPDQCMAKILSGCPVLEILSLEFCIINLTVIDLSKVLSLRTLEASIRDTGMEIVAPHIRCLRLTNYVYHCTLVDVSSLTEAQLEIRVNLGEIRRDGFPQVIMQKMVEKLQNVEKLTFGPNLLKILSVAELRHLPFPSFSVKDLTLEKTMSQDVIPGLVRLLQNSPQLKKLTLQPTLVNGTLLGKSLDDLLDVHGLMDSDQRWSSEARVFPNILTWVVEPKHVVSFIKLMLKTTKTLEKMVLKLGYYFQGKQVEELHEMVPMLCHDNSVSIEVISNKLNQRGLVSTVYKKRTIWSLPRILRHLWKARSAFIFEKTRYDESFGIAGKEKEDAVIWLSVNSHLQTYVNPIGTRWQKPVINVMKCNMGASWSKEKKTCGVAWIARYHNGKALFHGRRAFSEVSSKADAELLTILWAAESIANMKQNRIVFEASFEQDREIILDTELYLSLKQRVEDIKSYLNRIPLWSLEHTLLSRNQIAMEIAESVTRDNRHQSYIARKGPSWLQYQLDEEAKV